MPPPAPRSLFLGAPGVHYREVAPPPALASWVAAAWQLRADRPFELRILPDGCIDLIGGDVVGPMRTAAVARLQPGESAAGVRLRPGAFTALYGVPARELRDVRAPLAELVVPRPLAELARDAPPPDPLVAAALAGADLPTLCRESGYSARHVRRRLATSTGHGPKRLARIGRMQALLAAGRGESWARSAVDFGFYDEAHMAGDVRDLAGLTPHALLRGRFLQDAGAPAP